MFFGKKKPKPKKQSIWGGLFDSGSKKKGNRNKKEAFWDDCETNLPASSDESDWFRKK